MEKDQQNKFIASRIKQLTNEHNITISKLAQLAEINKSTINNIMNSGIVPTVSTIFSICLALNMTLPEFFDFYPYNKKEASFET